jgi:hypothetical protein
MKCVIEMGSDVMIYTKFHGDWFRHLGMITVITAAI